MHDFVDIELGLAIPYVVYDISANAGYVSVGIDPTQRSSPSTAFIAGVSCSDSSDTRLPTV